MTGNEPSAQRHLNMKKTVAAKGPPLYETQKPPWKMDVEATLEDFENLSRMFLINKMIKIYTEFRTN